MLLTCGHRHTPTPIRGKGLPGGCGRKMMEPRSQRRVSRGRKKSRVPLSKLRTSEVVRTVVDHPRRLQELLNLLEDKDRTVRGRAAATLARLSDSHSERLLRIVDRLRDNLVDESAYVRWHLAYVLGRVGSDFPSSAPRFLNELKARLDDENRIVKGIAGRAIEEIADRRPRLVQDLFETAKKDIPGSISRHFHQK
jgi:HEAT repeat protein